jgi:hypothetical protein
MASGKSAIRLRKSQSNKYKLLEYSRNNEEKLLVIFTRNQKFKSIILFQ